MPQDSPVVDRTKFAEPHARPLPDMTANVNALVDQVRAIFDGYQAAGEVLVVVDVLQWKALLTLHIPLPKP